MPRPCAPYARGAPPVSSASGGQVTLDVSPDLLRRQVTLVGSWTFSKQGQAECAEFIADRAGTMDALLPIDDNCSRLCAPRGCHSALKIAQELMAKAKAQGWGNYDAEVIDASPREDAAAYP